MQLEVGKIYDGKVTGITKFGAFVELDAKTTGMVHISEIANSFVNEIRDHITEGQAVKVKVITISDDGKISLSIKKAQDPPPRQQRPDAPKFRQNNRDRNANNQGGQGAPMKPRGDRMPPKTYDRKPRPSGPASFEDMLSKFKQNSEEKMSDLKRNMEGKRRGTSRRGGPKM